MRTLRTGALNYDTRAVSKATGLKCVLPSKTQQSQAKDADINVIVRRFGVTGLLPQGAVLPRYEDFEGIFDFQTAQNALVSAQRAFMTVPATIRRRFGNDPHEFVQFCSDPANIEELRKMGLAPKVKVSDVPSNSGGSSNVQQAPSGGSAA